MAQSPRADALRNRRAVLAAAQRLLAEDGPDHVSLDRVAQAAGVGKGTVFRRFGDRAGLLRAVLEERAAEIRAAVTATAGPLGTDAPPRERVPAFLDALSRLAADNASLLAQHGRACAENKFDDPSYRLWHRHLAGLLTEIDPARDADAAAHLVLSAIDGQLVRHVDEDAPGRFHDALTRLVTPLLDPTRQKIT